MNFKSFVATIRLYLKTFIAVTAVVFALCVAWILLVHTKYVSNAQLLVSLNGSSSAEAYENDSIVANRVSTYITLLNSDVVSQHVIDKMKLNMSAPDLTSMINATNVPPKTAVIDVAVADSSPKEAQQIAQTVADEFVSFANSMETPTGEGAQKVTTKVVSAASEPHRQRLVPVLLGVLSAMFAVILGAVAVWVRSAIDPVIRSGYRAANAAKAPVLGEVSAGDLGADSETPDSFNSFRQIRHRLRSAGTGANVAVVELTAVDDESEIDTRGVAFGLAQAMTIGGKRSVLLEIDAENANGEVIEGEPGSPDELALSEVTDQRVAPLRDGYDAVVIASPPVLSGLVPNAVSDSADAVVLLVATGKTKRREVARAATDLSGWGVPLKGVILVNPGDTPE